MRGFNPKYGLTWMLLLLVIVSGPLLYQPIQAQANSNHIVAQFTSSLTLPMPLPSIPLPSSAQLAPISGIVRILVIAVTFSDLNNTKPISQVKQEYFGTLSKYYRDVSYGTVSITGDVVGWYHLIYPMAYYGRDCNGIDSADCSGAPTSWWMGRDAVNLASLDKSVNFNNYDYFVILHAGPGEESSTNKDNIWSVSYLSGLWLQSSGKSISKFDIVPEFESSGAFPFGVYCHEFGHLLGLPDLYNTSNGHTILGPWELMDKGLWNGDPPGTIPAEMMAWDRIKLGWIGNGTLAVARDGAVANYTVDAIEDPSPTLIHAIMIPVSTTSPPTQYYLVEVRMGLDWDKAQPVTGVLISYINEKLYTGKVAIEDAHPQIPGLENATWTTGHVFTDQKNNIAIASNSQTGNTYQVTVNRIGPLPDLAVARISTQPASNIKPNDTVTIEVDVTNQGAASVTNVPVQIFLDAGLLTTQQVSLYPGQTSQITVPWTAVAGNHLVKAVIDPYDTLSELSRANNVATYVINVSGPNIVAGGVTLTVTTGNVNAWVSVNGVQYYPDNSTVVNVSVAVGPVTVQADPQVDISNGTRLVFTRWSDGNSSNPRQFNITSNTALSVIYTAQYLLQINPNGGTTSQGGWYNQNSNVTVVATTPSNVTQQASRLVFVNWSGDISSSLTSITVTVNKPVTLSANWKQQYYLAVISSVGTPQGSGWYDAGTSATVTVQQPTQQANNSRQVFAGWIGGSGGQDPTRTVVVNAPTILQASWKVQYLVQVQSLYGSSQGSGWYDSGAQAPISIQSEVDYGNNTRRIFNGWSGDVTGTSPSTTLTVDGPKMLTAQWTTQYLVSFNVAGLPNGTSVKLNINNQYHDVSISNSYRAWFSSGQQVNPTINQTLIAGYFPNQLVGWRNATGGAAPTPFVVNGPMQYTASYQQSMPMLPLPGFPIESILAGILIGALAMGLLRRRKARPHGNPSS
jgi:M6 family metalloprotease-like protein